MYHYIAALWNPDDPLAAETAPMLAKSLPDWQCALNADGLAVFLKPSVNGTSNVYHLPRERGIILGFLFPVDPSRFTGAPLQSIDEPTAETIISTHGRSLPDKYWGAYVAFLRDSEKNVSCVIRDCSGKLPCYRLHRARSELVFSDIGDLELVNSQKLSINWPYLISYIQQPTLESRDCGIREITELLAGDCLAMNDGSLRQFTIWDPYTISGQSTISTYADGLSQLRATTQYCIDAWASVYDKIVHYLSGGFDSTVVLSCLRRAPRAPQIVCLHQYSDGPRDNERYFAKLAADQARVRLFELPRNANAKFGREETSTIPISAKPSVSAFYAAAEGKACNEAAAQLGASCCWTGQGGDHLFFQMPTSLNAADYALTQGFDLGFISTLSDAAKLSRESFVHILCSALTHKYCRPTRAAPLHAFDAERFLDTHVVADSLNNPVPPSPASTDSHDVPPGKIFHISLLMEALNRNRPDPAADQVEMHHPLLSQPLLALSLQIPLHLLLRGGRPRAMARDAFRDIIPDAIAARLDKGEVTQQMSGIIRRSRGPLRDLFVNGILADKGILKVSNVLSAVEGSVPFRVNELWPLLACISAEAWLHAWHRSRFGPPV